MIKDITHGFAVSLTLTVFGVFFSLREEAGFFLYVFGLILFVLLLDLIYAITRSQK